ncbi:sarcosine oxidase subunit gamma [Chachezhania antarctica]|uniref:sarcosine oxidase subunit gamma n=1 Tax=Chachezhania antarctica TaxID=2340860 RepID=UPI000EAD7BE7|nr:sarcosine oxidase subunit gamma family protein [Chachezhania antarctica]|tara:strand:- start:3794 stop:4375 length:582 start_codon:yes stop_codon:yes gene_type:complete
MSDVKSVTALGGKSFGGLVRVAEAPLQGMITVRGDLGLASVKEAATGLTKAEMPATGRIETGAEGAIAWMSPDELLVLCAYADAAPSVPKMEDTMAKDFASAADVSDARAMFRLEGALSREVLAKLSPADLSVEGCAVGQMRRTRLAQVPAAIWFTDDETASVICFRSVADYVFALLKTAAQPGSAVGLAPAG